MREYKECDGPCSVRGAVKITKVDEHGAKVLYMCGHHTRLSADRLEAAGWTLDPDENCAVWLGPGREHLVTVKPREVPEAAFA